MRRSPTRNTFKASHANAKIAVLYQNDDLGKDYLKAPGRGLAAAEQIVSKRRMRRRRPTVHTRCCCSKASGADVVLVAATPKFAAPGDRKIAEIGWKKVTTITRSVGAPIQRRAGTCRTRQFGSAVNLPSPVL